MAANGLVFFSVSCVGIATSYFAKDVELSIEDYYHLPPELKHCI